MIKHSKRKIVLTVSFTDGDANVVLDSVCEKIVSRNLYEEKAQHFRRTKYLTMKSTISFGVAAPPTKP